MLERKIILTQDGTSTFHIPEWNESYHSTHGAYEEAMHVYINNGLKRISKSPVNILEIGFGTGLNAMLSLIHSENKLINYYGIEKYPLSREEVRLLNFNFLKTKEEKTIFDEIHASEWNKIIEITPAFNLIKFQTDFFNLDQLELPLIDLVYFDAFGARVQPELWEKPLLEMIYRKMNSNGLLTTYSSKGSFRRYLSEIGFKVEKAPGPKGKREMVMAFKVN